MITNARNFSRQVTALWIIPDTTTTCVGGYTAFHLEAYRSSTGCKLRFEEASRDIERHYKWSKPLTPAVEFRSTKHREPHVPGTNFVHNAPLEAWVVADCTNGSYYDEDGRVWVFAFPTRQAARSYVKACRDSLAGCIKFSAPMRMYQQPT